MLALGLHRRAPLTLAGRSSSFRAANSKIRDRDPGHRSVLAEARTGTHLRLNRQHAEGFGDAWVGLSSVPVGHPDPRSMTPTLEIQGSPTGAWYAVRTPPGAVERGVCVRPVCHSTGGPRGCPPRDPPLQRLPPTPRRPA
jgi:hypothetical protein